MFPPNRYGAGVRSRAKVDLPLCRVSVWSAGNQPAALGLEAASMDAVVELIKQAPDQFDGGALEIRQVASAEDFGDALTPELREQEARIQAEAEKHKS